MKPTRGRILREGFFAGLLGYLTVVVFVGLADLVFGRPLFYTPALMGRGLFGGEGPFRVTPDLVFSYNGVHLLAFLAIGFLVAWIVFEVELHPVFWYAAFLVLLGTFFLGFVAVNVVARSAEEGSLPAGTVLLANVGAALAMGLYLHHAHPRLWRRIRQADPEADG